MEAELRAELEKATELRKELDDVRRERRGLEAEWDGLVIRLLRLNDTVLRMGPHSRVDAAEAQFPVFK